MTTRQIFVNLPVEDLDSTVEFFTQLGFEFDPRFTDENATCMIIGDDSFVMLLDQPFFEGFIPDREIAGDGQTEVLVAISCGSRSAVDEMIEQAEAAGGHEYREAQDHGWMYARAFTDIDGHVWEAMHADESQLPEEMAGGA